MGSWVERACQGLGVLLLLESKVRAHSFAGSLFIDEFKTS